MGVLISGDDLNVTCSGLVRAGATVHVAVVNGTGVGAVVCRGLLRSLGVDEANVVVSVRAV